MADFETADFYTDKSLMPDPHAYFDYLRAKGPVTRLPYRNAVAVTGYDETIEVMLDAEHFSSINAVTGAMTKLPFSPEGDDIEAELEAARPTIPFADQIATENGIRHANLRSLISALFTPSRLKTLEPRLHSTADALIDEFIADGAVNLPRQYGGPYATLIISHLLGVPEDGRQRFRAYMEKSDDEAPSVSHENPLVRIGKDVYLYVARRRLMNGPVMRFGRKLLGREAVGDDILTELSLAKYPDGTTPSLKDLAALGAFLFAAGGDTTKLLLANGFRVIATRPELQDRLRRQPELIPNFVEEILRFDGSVKCAGRLCQKTTTLAGMEIKAGTPILLSHMAANRDPRRFEDPGEFRLDRARPKEHLAFGRGPHTCAGSPLARREVIISVERLLARLGNIRLSEHHHGRRDDPHFEYANNATLRVMKGLHLEFDRI
jgi:cytochrome P450